MLAYMHTRTHTYTHIRQADQAKLYYNTDATSALTGPISRGDTATVAAHIQALQQQPNNWQQVYRALGNTTRVIAAKQGQTSAENLSAIDRLLNSGTDHHD